MHGHYSCTTPLCHKAFHGQGLSGAVKSKNGKVKNVSGPPVLPSGSGSRRGEGEEQREGNRRDEAGEQREGNRKGGNRDGNFLIIWRNRKSEKGRKVQNEREKGDKRRKFYVGVDEEGKEEKEERTVWC